MSAVSNYVVYSSATLDALGLTIPQPNGSSRLCLSCHDGTIALGSVNSRTTPIAMQGGVTTMPSDRRSNLGTDLSGDHPISFVYDSTLASKDPQVKDPSSLTGKVKLDSEHRLQCTACHDPHSSQYDKFLVMDNTGSALCLQCHNVTDWMGSVHAIANQVAAPAATSPATALATAPLATASALKRGTATATKPGTATVAAAKPKTIAAQGCANCHSTHGAGGRERLMKSAVAEQNCLPCHSGGQLGTKDVASDFRKASTHPITQNNSTHSPKENPVNPSTRHVTCADCHNAHAARKSGGNTKAAGRVASLTDVKGVTATGATINQVNNEYELCFRCHGDSPGRGPAKVSRQVFETNKRVQFQTTSSSFHPIEGPGKNPFVPSLLAPWTTSSTMGCIDCHNSDQSPAAGGSGASGPHGSTFAPLLERQLVQTDYVPESPANYALCYKCHSRDSILADRSFRAVNAQGQERGHRYHIVDQKTACTTCHDSHGVRDQQKLINFNRDYVTRSGNGKLEYMSTGNGNGNCSLTCHGSDHIGTAYPSVNAATPFKSAPKSMAVPIKKL